LQRVELRAARAEDMAFVAGIFVASFPESIGFFFKASGEYDVRRVTDLVQWGFEAILRCERNFIVACSPARSQGAAIAGYCIYPASIRRFRKALLARSKVISLLRDLGRRRIRVKCVEVLKLMGNKLVYFLNSRSLPNGGVDSRILSIAVAPEFRGLGMGKALLERALSDLRQQGSTEVGLEVRPDNSVALNLYERAGFIPLGRFADAQGQWLAMVKKL